MSSDRTQLIGILSASLTLRRKTMLHMTVVMKLVTATNTNQADSHADANDMHRIPRISSMIFSRPGGVLKYSVLILIQSSGLPCCCGGACCGVGLLWSTVTTVSGAIILWDLQRVGVNKVFKCVGIFITNTDTWKLAHCGRGTHFRVERGTQFVRRATGGEWEWSRVAAAARAGPG